METAFEIMSPETIHETNLEVLKIVWSPDIPVIPPDYPHNQNTFKYLASNKHVGGYIVNNPCEWCIQLNPCYMEDGKRYISVFIWLHKFLRADKPVGKQSAHVMYQFELRCNGRNYTKFSSIHKFTEKKPCYGFKKCIPFPILNDCGNLFHRKITVGLFAHIMIIRDIKDFVFPCTIEDKCLLSADGNISAESASPFSDEEEIEKRRKLFFVNHAVKDKLSEIRKTGVDADVIIRSAKKEHRAHMSVLLARRQNKTIPYTSEMVNGKKMKIIEIKDMEDSTVSNVLDFCYDSYSKHFTSYKKILPILRLAINFQMQILVNQCVIEMASCITPKRFFHTLKAALNPGTDEETMKNTENFLRIYFIMHQREIRNGLKIPHAREQSLNLLTKLFLI